MLLTFCIEIETVNCNSYTAYAIVASIECIYALVQLIKL